MKRGRSIEELAVEIDRQQKSKRDFIGDTRTMSVTDDLKLRVPTEASTTGAGDTIPVRSTALRQLTDRVGIPSKYAAKLEEAAPDLLADNINHWLWAKPEQRMVRTLDGEVRGFLSDRYHRIDNYDVAETVLPILAETPGLKIVSTEITERKLYIRAVNTLVTGEVKVGDICEAGVCISNSEIGFGALVVEPIINRLVCLNGMKVNDGKYRRHHVGTRADKTEGVYELLTDETKQADDKAILLKARDVVRGALDREIFERTLVRLRQTTENRIEGDPVKAVEILGDTVGLDKEETTGVLRHLIEGHDLTQWGLLNAVTRQAQDVESYDRYDELEAAGGKVLDLSATQWTAIAEAA